MAFFRDKTSATEKLAKRQPTETPKYRDVFDDQQVERSSIAAKETMTTRLIVAVVLAVCTFIVVWVGYTFFQYMAANVQGSIPYVYVTDSGESTYFTLPSGSGSNGGSVGSNGGSTGGSQTDTRPMLYYDSNGTFLSENEADLAGDVFYDRDGYRVNRAGQYIDAEGNVVTNKSDAWPGEPGTEPTGGSNGSAGSGQTSGDVSVPEGVDPSKASTSNPIYIAWRDANFTLVRKGTSVVGDQYMDGNGQIVWEDAIRAQYIDAYARGDAQKVYGQSQPGGGNGNGGGSAGSTGTSGQDGTTGTVGESSSQTGTTGGQTSGSSSTEEESDPWVVKDYPGPYYNEQGELIGNTAPDDGSALYDANGNLVRQATLVPEGGKEAGEGTQVEMFDVPGLGAVPRNNIHKVKWTYYLFKITFLKLLLSFGAAFAIYGLLYTVLKKNLDAQNLTNDTSDINQYHNDQHIQTPQELQIAYDWFPDVGAHAPVQVSSMISHMMLSKKGLKLVPVIRRADKDIRTKDGELAYFKGEALLDADGEPIVDKLPIIDEKFGKALFDASGLPDAKDPETKKPLRVWYTAKDIAYNPGDKNRDKVKGAETVQDLINKYWTFPEYEPQRPAGAYIVDTQPVNTMVLAITRAGKGQTVIEPTIDMWTREAEPNNMVINDPKGELLVKFYVRATVRGFRVVQFNLINAMKTDIYNPLSLAAEAAREGDFTKCAMYVENIADVFFPVDGGDDPVWPNAANNAFKRAAYGLIDFYLEEEKQMRLDAERMGLDEALLATRIDQMWGKCTLYNCYRLFTSLTSKKLKNPLVEFKARAKNGDFDKLKDGEDPNALPANREPLSDEEFNERKEQIIVESSLWEDKPEADLLTLFFNATASLPVNGMRQLISNANEALRSMAGAEKMLSSVYGIAITAMSFFADPTISTLTSGTPSQNVDLGGLSFPRRFGVRFDAEYLERYSLKAMQCQWDAFEDKKFEKPLGKDFYHEDLITREGWAMCYFKGKFAKDVAYLRLRIVNPQNGFLIFTYYFEFRKSYQMSLDGRYYVTDPVLGSKIVKDGRLIELRMAQTPSGEKRWKRGKTTYKKTKIVDILDNPEKQEVDVPTIIRMQVHYSDQPKVVFLVTPPHLMKYAKLILILIKQLVDLNFDKSYMTKSNQKPLYKTRYMLDELGNLQSEGHGISNFQTMLSIGLGQDQQFTLILQTLQQLRDVYGESVDKIVQGNTSNIVFLKSTDDSMLDTLQKMSGITHRVFRDGKTVTRDMQRIAFQNEGKVNISMSVKEMPVITYNDMAFIAERNSIVFRAGDSPIWNRNETILPMSWRLFQNTIVHPGKDYTLQTIPTLSSALEFDVRKNMPDFVKMWEKRKKQAEIVKMAKDAYQKAYGYSDYEVEQLDPDTYSDEIMQLVNDYIMQQANGGAPMADEDEDLDEAEMFDQYDEMAMIAFSESMDYEDNDEQLQATQEAQAKRDVRDTKKFARNLIAPSDLIDGAGRPVRGLEQTIVKAYQECRAAFENDPAHFFIRDGSLVSAESKAVFISKLDERTAQEQLERASEDPDLRVFAENAPPEDDDGSNEPVTYRVEPAFYAWLAKQSDWLGFAGGRFEEEMIRLMMAED